MQATATCQQEQPSASSLCASWAQKIEAIKMAADCMGETAMATVECALNRGTAHMEYKDFAEFDCECADQYVFQEAQDLIESLRLPFDMALSVVVSTSQQGQPGGAAVSLTFESAVMAIAKVRVAYNCSEMDAITKMQEAAAKAGDEASLDVLCSIKSKLLGL